MWGRLPQIRAFPSLPLAEARCPWHLGTEPCPPRIRKLLPKAVAGNRFLILSSHEGEGIGVHLL